MPPHIYFVKFQNNKIPDRFVWKTYEEMFYELKEFMFRNNTGLLEWMIRE